MMMFLYFDPEWRWVRKVALVALGFLFAFWVFGPKTDQSTVDSNGLVAYDQAVEQKQFQEFKPTEMILLEEYWSSGDLRKEELYCATNRKGEKAYVHMCNNEEVLNFWYDQEFNPHTWVAA